jgi:uncharacterized protein YndB with AHSA1/START domain
MNDVAARTLSLDLTRSFAAPPERVFDAWLGTAWGEWLPPRGARCTVTLMEPHVGGRYVVSMTMPDGRMIEITGVYREIDRPRRLSLTWTGNYNNQETVITISFRADGPGTLMTLRQEGFSSPDLRDGYANGWSGEGGSFAKLDVLLARASS